MADMSDPYGDYECYEDYDRDYDYEPEFDWDDLAEDIDRRFAREDWLLERAFSDLGYENGPWPPPGFVLRRPFWWVLIDGHPDGLEITEVSTHDDVWSNGLFGIPRYPYPHRLLINSTVELKLEGERWPVKSYVLSRPGDDSPAYLHSVLALQPPSFGHWMPSLKEPW